MKLKTREFTSTAVFVTKETKPVIIGLSSKASQLFLWIVCECKRTEDWVKIDNRAHKKGNPRAGSLNTVKAAIKELTEKSVICQHNELKNIYWINPIYIYKDTLKVQKNGSDEICCSYIYKCTEKRTGKSYIGKTKSAPFFRWWHHLTHSNSPFGLYLKKTKLSDWTFEVLEELPYDMDDYQVLLIESEYIKQFDSINNGFNSVISIKSVNAFNRTIVGKNPFTQEK